MHRRLFAGGLDFLVRGVQFGNPQVVFDAVVEQVGLLGDEALHLPQIVRIDIRNPCAGMRYAAFLHVPEPHEQLKQRRLPAAAASHNTHDAVFRYLHRYIRKDGFAPVGKGDVFRRSAGKGN